MKNCISNTGFTLIDVLILLIIGGILAMIFFLFAFGDEWKKFTPEATQRRALEVKCKSNLDQMGKAMMLYLLDFGYSVRYPARNGGGFFTTLYQSHILVETAVFQCPATSDTVTEETLTQITAEDPDDLNGISYAGRKNEAQQEYPGIFRPMRDTTTTPIGADDWQGTPNHDDGRYVNFLFLDGHTDHLKETTAKGNDYAAFLPLSDPLTN